MSKAELSCDPKYIVKNIGAIKKEVDKVDYIADTLQRCTVSPPKKKRGMTNYNCFMRVQNKVEQKKAKQENRDPVPFKELLRIVKQSGSWNLQTDKQKKMWRRHANEGCPPRLWQ